MRNGEELAPVGAEAKDLAALPSRKDLLMESYHHAQTGEPSILVAFDLREPEGWKSAHDLRAAWGASHSRVHVLDPDHIVLELLAGCSSGFDAKESA